MLKDKVKKDPGAAKKRGYQLVEMSDGTLRVRPPDVLLAL